MVPRNLDTVTTLVLSFCRSRTCQSLKRAMSDNIHYVNLTVLLTL